MFQHNGKFQYTRTKALAVLASLLSLFMVLGITSGAAAQTASAGWTTVSQTTAASQEQALGNGCPTGLPSGVQCFYGPKYTAALTDNGSGCNYSKANRPVDLPVYGIVEHTTEGTLAAALNEAQDTSNCVSWNYLIDQNGNIYVSVPPQDLAYDDANWWSNTHNIQVEHVGQSEDCSTLTPAEMKSSEILDRWLIWTLGINPTPAMITGHQSVPAAGASAGSTAADQTAAHWDPGYCWPWAQYLAAIGAPIVPTAPPNSPVITIRASDSDQPIQDCPGAGFTDCTSAPASLADHTNFVAMYANTTSSGRDEPSNQLIADPYLHASGSGSTAEQDWGDKAVTGRSYVVIGHKPGWTEVWYEGQRAWFMNNGQVSVPTSAYTVRPKGSTAVTLYARPLPDYDNVGWNSISYDFNHTQPIPLADYSMSPGQQYVVVAAPTQLHLFGVPPLRTDYAEGCNLPDCTGTGDGTVVIDGPTQTQYIEVSFGGRDAFVNASDVNVVAPVL